MISLLSCHILLEQTTSYEVCFNFSVLTLFISLVITILTYFSKDLTFLPYSSTMLGIVIINWLIPSIHCFLRYMFEYGTKIDDYTTFYRNTSIVFFLFYLGVLFYGAISNIAFPWAYRALLDTANVIPFQVIATQIEDYLYGLIPLSDISTYLISRSLSFLPYGFYITLVLRRQTRLTRFFALLFLPFVLEVLQYIIIPNRCDIDDIIYAMIGGILGSLSLYLLIVIFHAVSGKEFLEKDANYRFSNSSIHF
ncbi:MAG: VanZ family protein [Mobilitalea sp.]